MVKKFFLLIAFLLLVPFSCTYAQQAGEAYLQRAISTEPVVINLSLEPSPFTGEAQTSVPIELLPATGDIQQKINISLQYRSGGGNSWLGRGWDLEPGHIVRVNKYGTGHANNPYLLVLNGQAFELVNTGGVQYRTKHETHMKIEFYGTSWKVWEKDGTQYLFDLFSGTRWVLTRITDTHGIAAVFDYDRASVDEIYLREIRYPEAAGLTPYCTVRFISEDRPDKLLSYYYGPAYRINRRLKEIQVLAESHIQKRYVLAYATNGTTNISLLSAITQYGKDGQSLPVTSFVYQPSLRAGIYPSSQEWLPNRETYTHEAGFEGAIGQIPARLNMAFIDMNGDNLPDLIGCKLNAQRQYEWIAHVNTGSGFSPAVSIWVNADKSFYPFYFGGTTFYYSITLQNATLVDMNRDGLPDLVYSKWAGSISWQSFTFGVPNLMVRFNTGSGFSDTETKFLDYTQSWFSSYDNVMLTILKIGETALLADMNGDGLPDLIYHKLRAWESWGGLQYGVSEWVVRMNTGSGFSTQEQVFLSHDKAFFKYQVPVDPFGSLNRLEAININQNATLADMNGDGLLDLVYNDFSSAVATTQPPDVGQRVSLVRYNWKVRYNTGSRFSDTAVTLYADAPVYFYQEYSYYTRISGVRIGSNGTLADINGDGLLDLVFNEHQQDSPDHPSMPFKVCFNTGDRFSAPVSLAGTFGHFLEGSQQFANVKTFNADFLDMNGDGTADFLYPYFLSWQYGNAQFTVKVLPNTGSLATDLLTQQTSPYGGTTTINYSSSALFDNTGGDGRNDLGFILPMVSSVVKNPGVGLQGTTGFSYSGGWYDLPAREFRGFRYVEATDPLGYVSRSYFLQDLPRLGKLEKVENATAKTTYLYQNDQSAPYFTPPVQVDECVDLQCRRTLYSYDSDGNSITTVYLGDIAVAGDEKSVYTDYVKNSSSWILSLPSRQRIYSHVDDTGMLCAEAQSFYDNHTVLTDSPIKGDLTKVKNFRSLKNDFLETSATYDSYGNQLTKTDANGHVASTTYDTTYRYLPVSLTNPKGHIEQRTYYQPSDSKGIFEQVKSIIDPNGVETIFEYDGFGRKTKVIGPYDTFSTYGSESYEYGINGPGANYVVTRTTETNGTSSAFVKIDLLDGFERVIQNAQESEDTDSYRYSTTRYNARGEIDSSSLPYLLTGGMRLSYSAPDASVKWMTHAYDALGRIVRITRADLSTVKNTYSGWSVIREDENGHLKTIAKDAFDRIISVKEKNGPEEYLTRYIYDALGNLVRIVDHLGNMSEFYYNSLSQMVQMADPDLGTWIYDYDNNGNMISRTDANGVITTVTYDELNRIAHKDYSTSSGVEITYRYDEPEAVFGIGRKTSMTDESGGSRWYYDKEGRTVKLDKIVDVQTYSLQYEYDGLDRLRSIAFPNTKTVTYTYNNAGLTESIEGYVTNADYNASQQVIRTLFANAHATAFDYSPENQRLKSIVTGSLQYLMYQYDQVGNITTVRDTPHGLIKEYAYDDLDRLLLGDGMAFGYNALGNIMNSNGVQREYAYRPHALTFDGVYNYSYDSCGNMTAGGGRLIAYDPENKPRRIDYNGITTRFVYDGDGTRVKKTVTDGTTSTTTIYIENLYEKEICE